MYNSQELVNKIKARAKERGILVKDMLLECGLNINTLNQMTDKKGISSFALARIADLLDCSVDYLLGRTEVSNSHKHTCADEDGVAFSSRLRLAMMKADMDVRALVARVRAYLPDGVSMSLFTAVSYAQGIYAPAASSADVLAISEALGVSSSWLDGSEVIELSDTAALMRALFPNGEDVSEQKRREIFEYIHGLNGDGTEKALGVTDSGDMVVLAAARSTDDHDIKKEQKASEKWQIIEEAPDTDKKLI